MLNEKYSHRDFTNKVLTDTDPEEWNDTEVVGSAFAKQIPDTEVFPRDMTNVTFINCNLDNVVVPETCTIQGGCARRWLPQKDNELWIVDKSNNPVEPVNKARFIKMGLSIDPATIPTTEKAIPVTQEKMEQLEAALQADIKALEDAADWR